MPYGKQPSNKIMFLSAARTQSRCAGEPAPVRNAAQGKQAAPRCDAFLLSWLKPRPTKTALALAACACPARMVCCRAAGDPGSASAVPTRLGAAGGTRAPANRKAGLLVTVREDGFFRGDFGALFPEVEAKPAEDGHVNVCHPDQRKAGD